MMKTTQRLLITTSILTFALNSCATNPPVCASKAASKCGTKTATKIKPYPLDTCMVIGAKLSSTPKTYTRIYKGQEVKFCCTSCIKAFEANPEIYLAKIR